MGGKEGRLVLDPALLSLTMPSTHTWNPLALREIGKIRAILILLKVLNLIQITLASPISPDGALGCLGSCLCQDVIRTDDRQQQPEIFSDTLQFIYIN